jgi:hypothetical protein
MWELVGFLAGLFVLLVLIALLSRAFDLPDSIAKLFGGRMRPSEVETRLLDLEAQLSDLRAALGIARPTGKNASSWSARLDAVDAVSNPDHRNEALCKVAEDASAAGEAAMVQTALGKIADPDMRNETACICAVKLAKAGRSAEAIEVAKTISDADQRDETLSRLAIG